MWLVASGTHFYYMTSAQCKIAGVRMSGHIKKITNVIRSKWTKRTRFYRTVSCNINISLIMSKQMSLLFFCLKNIITSLNCWLKCHNKSGKSIHHTVHSAREIRKLSLEETYSEIQIKLYLIAIILFFPFHQSLVLSANIWICSEITCLIHIFILFIQENKTCSGTSVSTLQPAVGLMINIWTGLYFWSTQYLKWIIDIFLSMCQIAVDLLIQGMNASFIYNKIISHFLSVSSPSFLLLFHSETKPCKIRINFSFKYSLTIESGK